MLTDMLNAATLETGRIELRDEPVALAGLIRAALRMVESTAKARDLTLTLALDETIVVRADPVHLRQVVINILSNAVKYTPNNGRVDIDAHRNGQGVEILVRDTGIGIAAENLDWVMTPFARATNDAFVAEQPGVGLGLAIAKSLMDLHGGTLTLTSVPRHGTLVTLRLPADRVIAGS